MGEIIDKIALIHINDNQILMAKSFDKDTYYIPGGKRHGSETDKQTLTREISEELSVDLLPATLKYYGTFSAQAHGKAEGTMVKMTCYRADFVGKLNPGSEIEEIAYYSYAQRDIVGPVDQLIFDDLRNRKLI